MEKNSFVYLFFLLRGSRGFIEKKKTWNKIMSLVYFCCSFDGGSLKRYLLASEFRRYFDTFFIEGIWRCREK